MNETYTTTDDSEPLDKRTVHLRSKIAEVVGFARTMPGEAACGDALAVYEHEQTVTLLSVDGLGHGRRANEASVAAVEHVTQRLQDKPRLGLEELMTGCHRALSGTRGAAIGICRLDAETNTVRFCGVGNIAMLSAPGRRGIGVSLPGVVGYRMRKVKEFVCECTKGDLVALHSDGVSSSVSLRKLVRDDLQALVELVERDFGKDHDDASFVVMRILGAGASG